MKKIVIALIATLALPASAQSSSKIYAQELIEETLVRNPEVLELTMHVAPKGSDNVVIASNRKTIGVKSGPDDLAVIDSGRPRWKIGSGGDRFESEFVLMDMTGDTVGAIEIVLPFYKGADASLSQIKAEQIRNALRRRIINIGNLMDPVPYVQNFNASPFGQKLIDETMEIHPELLVLVMHVLSQNGSDYPIIASSIGRIGKKADEGDRQVAEGGAPILGTYGASKNRFGIELPLRDVSGKVIGALSTGFSYKEGDDQQVLLQSAQQIEAALSKQIPSLAKLLAR